MSRRYLLLGLGVVVAVAAWYAFRPERLFLDQTVAESFPAEPVDTTGVGSVMLAKGVFHSNAHETKGVATIYRLPDGNRVLRLTEFETSNGPDVQVYLVAAADVNDNAAVTRTNFVSLGAIKGNIGDQNYRLPADLDLATYRSVTIWCRRFSVNFGTAPLSWRARTLLHHLDGTCGGTCESRPEEAALGQARGPEGHASGPYRGLLRPPGVLLRGHRGEHRAGGD